MRTDALLRIAVNVLPLLALVACSSAGGGSTGQSAGASSSQGGAPASGASGGGGGSGPSYGSFGGSGAGTCVPQAPTTFADAVCVCGDLGEAGVLHTIAPSGGSASVGVNGRAGAATGAWVQGGFVAYEGLDVAGDLQVRDSVESTADLTGAGVLDVGGDLEVGGHLTFVGTLSVDGTLALASPSTVLIPLHVGSMGAYAKPAGPPCGCAPSTLLPISQVVAQAATVNDDAAHGLDPSGASLIGAGTLSLPSGTYYFKDVARIGLAKIEVTGHVALAFDGALVSLGVGLFDIAPGASLDVYVTGLLGTAGAVKLGDPTHPEAFRLFVGGAGGMIATAGVDEWDGLIYAPQADIAFAGVTAVHGSVFANQLAWAGLLEVTYAGASQPGSSCTAPPAGTTPPGGTAQ
jgi:hypothetical protein